MFKRFFKFRNVRLFSSLTKKEEQRDLLQRSYMMRDIIAYFRRHGHYISDTNPLIDRKELGGHLGDGAPKLQHMLRNFYDNGKIDLTPFNPPPGVRLDDEIYLGSFMRGRSAPPPNASIRELIEYLIGCYSGKLAYVFSHLRTEEEHLWVLDRVQPQHARSLSPTLRLKIWKELMKAEEFELFLKDKYPTAKVFSLAGLESLIPGLQFLVESACLHSVDKLIFGMSHRGRLTTMTRVLKKDLRETFAEFDQGSRLRGENWFQLDDVKYHLAASELTRIGGAEIELDCVANPSHLELVGPVVLGRARAEQTRRAAEAMRAGVGFGGLTSHSSTVPVLIHGDASFAGQGIVSESLQMMNLPYFSVGGTVHVILDNQIGFTSDRHSARSTPYAADVARAFGSLILVASADDPESVVHALRTAFDFRLHFGKDAIVSICGYRRFGHNEMDDPSIMHPRMHQRIQDHPTVVQLYTSQLELDGVLAEGEAVEHRNVVRQKLHDAYQARDQVTSDRRKFLIGGGNAWQADVLTSSTVPSGGGAGGGGGGGSHERRPDYHTGVPAVQLRKLGSRIFPRDPPITLHPHVDSVYQRRRKAVLDGVGIDMATAEALAFGSVLLFDKKSVRLSGQDCERGTFNQRHAVCVCQDDDEFGRSWTPLQSVEARHQAITFEAINSPLTEAAVLGFEYGYSVARGNDALVVWEAQFGDFLNMAQPIVDCFIASGEQKWREPTRLTMLLPHGADGQGPDHSSARIERLLQLCNDDADAPPGSGLMASHFLAAVRQGFDAVDRDGNGSISRDEVVEVLSAALERMPHEHEVKALFDQMDHDHSGQIDRDEWIQFCHWWLEQNPIHTLNLIVAYPTTPANLFHILRAQVKRPAGKPCAVLVSKWLLHHRPCTSTIEEFEAEFQPIIVTEGKWSRPASDDGTTTTKPGSNGTAQDDTRPVERVFFCTGQVYYPLFRALNRAAASSGSRGQAKRFVVVRLERLSPFPSPQVRSMLSRYPGNAELVFCQEEAKNQGAFEYVRRRLQSVDPEKRPLHYVGRGPSASPASGSFARHQTENQMLMDEAVNWLFDENNNGGHTSE